MDYLKNYYLFLLFIFCLASCKRSNVEISNEKTIISGEFPDGVVGTVKLLDAAYQKVIDWELDSQGVFKDTLTINTGFYYIRKGRRTHKIFLESMNDISLNLKDPSLLQVEGNLSKEHIYLEASRKLEDEINAEFSPDIQASWDEGFFLEQMELIHQKRMNIFDEYKRDLSQAFIKYEKMSLHIAYLYSIANYQNTRRYFRGEQDYKVSGNYPDVLSEFDFENIDNIKIPKFRNLLLRHLRDLSDADSIKNAGGESYLKVLQTLKNNIKNKEVQEWMTRVHSGRYFSRTDSLEAYYNLAKSMIRDTSILAELDNKYKSLSPFAIGKPVPDFEFYDINNQLVSLDDFKGKIVYLDIWATWCKPCIKEFPNKKSLQSEFKNEKIEFVSICRDRDKSKWKEMVKEYNLGGVQLYADIKKDNAFFEKIQQKSYPTYILIDEEGNFSDRYATRPSNIGTKGTIESLLSVM